MAKNPVRPVLLLLLLCCAFRFTGEAQFRTLQTKNLCLIYYDEEEEYLLSHIGRCFENSLAFHRRLFSYTPTERVTVFLHDLNDYGTGGTNSLPWNYLNIGIEPYDYAYATSPTNERMNWVMNHELAHLVDLDKSASIDRTFRSMFFGKVVVSQEHPLSMFYSYLTSPRYYSPRWYHEGLAVFMETWMAGGIGRTLGGFDEMVFRTMVLDSSYFYDFVGLESEGKTIDFQIGAKSYLYGTRFVSYLARTYGPERILDWLDRSEGSSRYFASQFKKLYHRELDKEWREWISFERRWQAANLDSIRKFEVTPERRVVKQPLGSVSRAFYDSSTGKAILAVNYPGRFAHIASLDVQRGNLSTICDITTPALYYVTSLAFDDSSGNIFFTTHNTSQWRDLNVVNARTGEENVLLKNCRVGDLVINKADKSLWGVRHHAGYSTLVRIPRPYTSVYDILPLQYGKDLFDIDISHDGALLSGALVEINGRQRLVSFAIDSLMVGQYRYDVLYEFENDSPENFVFSNDGRSLYGSSYISGVSNIFQYNFESKKMDALSNCETGYFRPIEFGRDSLMVLRFTDNGFLPVIIPKHVREDVSAIKYLGQDIVDKFSVVTTWKVGSPTVINIDSLTTYRGEYHPLSQVNVSSGYPIVLGYKAYVAYGFTLNFSDPLGLHNFEVTAAYSPYATLPLTERMHASANYRYWQWKVSGTYNRADFYDLFGPTKSSRKGYSLGVSYTDFLLNDKPHTIDYSLAVTGYAGLDRLPEYQNVETDFDNFITVNAYISSKEYLRTLGAIDYEKGLLWSVHSLNTIVRAKYFPQVYTTANYGILLPIDHSSLWFRAAGGYSPGERDESFSNFYFGGFGNNWIDYQEIERYREYYSFPGVTLNEIDGTNFAKLLLEWSLPPIRFRRFGIPNWYCTYAHFSLFATAIGTNLDDAYSRRSLANLGAQVDIKLVLFTSLESTLSFGYAYAYEKNQRRSHEIMASLRIL